MLRPASTPLVIPITNVDYDLTDMVSSKEMAEGFPRFLEREGSIYKRLEPMDRNGTVHRLKIGAAARRGPAHRDNVARKDG